MSEWNRGNAKGVGPRPPSSRGEPKSVVVIPQRRRPRKSGILVFPGDDGSKARVIYEEIDANTLTFGVPKVALSDKRRSIRKAIRLAADLRVNSTSVACHVENLSGAGAFITTGRLWSVDSCVALTLTHSKTDRPVVVRGEVRWISAGTAPGRRGMGLRFVGLSPAVKGALSRVLRQRRVEQGLASWREPTV